MGREEIRGGQRLRASGQEHTAVSGEVLRCGLVRVAVHQARRPLHAGCVPPSLPLTQDNPDQLSSGKPGVS